MSNTFVTVAYLLIFVIKIQVVISSCLLNNINRYFDFNNVLVNVETSIKKCFRT